MAYKRKEKAAEAVNKVETVSVELPSHEDKYTPIPRLAQLLTTEELQYIFKLDAMYKRISPSGLPNDISVGQYQLILEVGTGTLSRIVKVLKEIYHPRNPDIGERKAAERLLVAQGWATFSGELG